MEISLFNLHEEAIEFLKAEESKYGIKFLRKTVYQSKSEGARIKGRKNPSLTNRIKRIEFSKNNLEKGP